MAHELDTSNGRANMAYVGKTPWHGLGQRVKPNDSITSWREAAGLMWTADRTPALYEIHGRQYPTGEYVIYRSDTGHKLGTVSPSYHTVQPKEVLDFFRHFVEDLGSFEMHTVGSLREGRRIWALAKAKDDVLKLGGDVVGRYLLLATSYDKTMATVIQQTSIRVVCNNTLVAAYGRGSLRDPVIRVSHHGAFDASKVRARMLFDEQWSGFTRSVERWASYKVSKVQQDEYFRKVLAFKAPQTRRADDSQKMRIESMHEILRDAPGQRLESARDTVWGLVNAVSWHVDHNIGGNADIRMDQAWFGSRKQMKRRAIEQAEELVH